MKVSIITTVLNEANSVIQLLESILKQTMQPDEVVIVDAGSTDGTVEQIRKFADTHPAISIRVFIQPGNRSVGRNRAIQEARYNIIAATDAGCIVDASWLEKITKPFDDEKTDFVGGWYVPTARTAWQHSLVKVLNYRVEAVNPKTFLPSTRSMAFRKELWSRVGGFNERNSHSEDTPFSIAMRKASKQFIFVPDAIVRWSLVQGYGALFRTISRYALGDGEQRLWISQYRLLSLGFLLEIGFIIAGFIFSPILWLFGAACLLSYLYLPLMATRFPRHMSSFYQVPLMKATIISANLFGFYRGLLRRSTSPASNIRQATQP